MNESDFILLFSGDVQNLVAHGEYRAFEVHGDCDRDQCDSRMGHPMPVTAVAKANRLDSTDFTPETSADWGCGGCTSSHCQLPYQEKTLVRFTRTA
jgi:hypothetical protein